MSAITANALQQRLSEQLQALSLVGETLTLRLLELEERLASLEDQLLDLQVNGREPTQANPATEALLAATDERITRLEELLTDEVPVRSRHLQPVSLGRSDAGGSTIGAAEDELELDPDPFPEEEEQPFMDELSA
jgi:hypothetical protein